MPTLFSAACPDFCACFAVFHASPGSLPSLRPPTLSPPWLLSESLDGPSAALFRACEREVRERVSSSVLFFFFLVFFYFYFFSSRETNATPNRGRIISFVSFPGTRAGTPPRNPALPPHKGQQRIQQSKIPRTHRECSLLHLPRLRGVSLPCGVAHALFFSPARRRPRRLSSTGSGSHSRAREFVVSPPDSLLPVRFRTTVLFVSSLASSCTAVMPLKQPRSMVCRAIQVHAHGCLE